MNANVLSEEQIKVAVEWWAKQLRGTKFQSLVAKRGAS